MSQTKEIIKCILENKNDKALKYLYKKPLNTIRGYIISNSGSLDDANDVFQEAVLNLFQHVKKGKFNNNYTIDAFLFVIAKNIWIDTCKRKKRMPSEAFKKDVISDSSNILNDLISKEKLKVFYDMFNKLEENCQQILQLVLFEGKSMKTVAKQLNYKSDKVVKNQHYRCKKYLLQIITENKKALETLKN